MAHRRWIWCRDTKTGHHYDVDERQLPRLVKQGAVEPVKGYPVNEGPDARPRPTKPNAQPTAEPKQTAASQPDNETTAPAGKPADSRRESR